MCADIRAAAVARANEAKKKSSSPQKSVLSSIGRDLDRCVDSMPASVFSLFILIRVLFFVLILCYMVF